MSAITLDHMVVFQTDVTPRLLFHELVYVVQYRLLGIEAFVKRYVRGFLTGGSYEAIPLEVCARTLEEKFASGHPQIRVEQEVQRWIAGEPSLPAK